MFVRCREEYTPLFDFVNAKKLRIKNKGGKGGSSSLDHMIESDGEDHDAYLRQMKREGAERDEEDEDDSSEYGRCEMFEEDIWHFLATNSCTGACPCTCAPCMCACTRAHTHIHTHTHNVTT